MEELTSAQGETGPAMEGLKLKEDYLSLDNIPEWLTWPMFPDALKEISVAFTTSKGEDFLFCTNGFLIMVPTEENEAMLFKGKTLPYNSNVVLRKTPEGYHWKGIIHGETADYSIKKTPDGYVIDGDTGKYRSDYTIAMKDKTITVQGDTGKFNSNIDITCTDRDYAFTGFVQGDKIETSLYEDEGRLFFEGTVGGVRRELIVEMKDHIICVAGEQESHRTEFSIKEVPEGLILEGIFKSKKGRYTVTRDNEAFLVKGGFAGNIVEYTISHTD